MTDAQKQAIRKHGENLLAIFPNAKHTDPVKLCKALRRLERQANDKACDYCNGVIDCEDFGAYEAQALAALRRILGAHDVPVFVNGDARGYALKVDDEWLRASGAVLYRDWGGYGILAPEINKEGR